MKSSSPRVAAQRSRLIIAALLAPLLLVGSIIGAVRPASAATPEQKKAAADWLYAQTKDGAPGFSAGTIDTGLTIDALWGLMAAGAPADQLNRVGDVIASKAAEFGTPNWGEPEVSSGGTGKLLLAAASLGRDPLKFGGVNVRANAVKTVQPSGQVFDLTNDKPTQPGNLFAQSLAMMGLARTGDLPATTVDFLVTQQCSAGHFRIFTENPAKTCDEGQGAPDRDATAMAVMALLAARDKGVNTAKADSSLAKAYAWLESDQAADGSFIGSPWTPSPNSNSTGLVAAALQAGGRTAAAAKAGDWVASVQLMAANAGKAADHVGAIAYDKEALTQAQSAGITDQQGDQWRRASAQAILGLAPVSLHRVGMPRAGYAGACTDTRGVTVVVDYQDLVPTKATETRCAPNFPADGTGLTALQLAGFTPTGTRSYGLAFICRIEGRPAADEPITLPGNPTYTEACVRTPPTSAFWSYWQQDGADWALSSTGASTSKPKPGSWQGFSFSHNATASTNPKPRVTPTTATPTPTPTPSPTATSTPTPQPGHAGACTDATGVTMVVDFQDLKPEKETVVRCAPNFPANGTGLDALKLSGITHEGVKRWGDAFICRLEGRPAADEPIAIPGNPTYTERCIDTPPGAAYWSYWHAENGGTWEYSQMGVMGYRPKPGTWEGWSFSHNASASTNPAPRVNPVRPGTPTPTPTATPTPTPTATPKPEPKSPITLKWESLGGAAGPVGAPRIPEFCDLKDSGCFRHFAGGSIYDSAATDPQWVRGAIRDRWAGLGWETGQLGFPTSDEICGLKNDGCVSRFQGGLVYWSPASGSHPVWGEIGKRYASLGWENSPLGYPVTGEFCDLRDGGCWQAFQGGAIYWSPRTGAWPVWGSIREEWAKTRWEMGPYGYPMGLENCTPTSGALACTQQFERRLLRWDTIRGLY